MRHILVSAARRHLAQKRGGDAPRVTFDEHIYATPMKAEKLITLDEALEELHQQDPRMAQVVECRFFAGLSIEETAAALDVSPRTVRRDWRTARAFLADKLGTSAS
jgi:RNA polymerase sigma factor (TIGR02999 family)